MELSSPHIIWDDLLTKWVSKFQFRIFSVNLILITQIEWSRFRANLKRQHGSRQLVNKRDKIYFRVAALKVRIVPNNRSLAETANLYNPVSLKVSKRVESKEKPKINRSLFKSRLLLRGQGNSMKAVRIILKIEPLKNGFQKFIKNWETLHKKEHSLYFYVCFYWMLKSILLLEPF